MAEKRGVTTTLQSCLRTPPDAAACAKLPAYLVDNICAAVKILCGGGLNLPGTRGTASSSSAAGNPLTNLLGSVLDGNGLNRAAPGETDDVNQMWRAFDEAYDTDLVSIYSGPLLVSATERGAER